MKKKISQITAYIALGVIAIAVLLCAILKLNFKPEIGVPTYASSGVQVRKTEGDYTSFRVVDKEDEYNKLVGNFNDSFKLTILYSLFSGKIGSETTVTHVKSKASAVGYEVKFNFVEEQVFVNKGEEIEYSKIYFSVEQGKGLEEKTIWLEAGEDDYYKITTIADFDDLAKCIANFKMFKVEDVK